MIAFRADGNSCIGMGHLTRCLSIYQELEKRGVSATFIISPDTDISFLESSKVDFIQLKEEKPNGWSADETILIIYEKKIDLLVIDSYRVSQDDFKKIKKHTKTVYIDDLYSYSVDVDIIINCNIDARKDLYIESRQNKRIYTGVQYYPLRQEFFSYLNSPIRENVERVMITTGSTDPYHCAYQIIKSLSVYDYLSFYVLIGAFYPTEYIDKITCFAQKYQNIEIVNWGGNIAKTMANCDMVISSGSSTVFEALSIGVPCITFQFADNHKTECNELNKLEMAPFAGIYDSFDNKDTSEKLKGIFQEELKYDVRLRRFNIYSKAFDGKGLERITNIICDEWFLH